MQTPLYASPSGGNVLKYNSATENQTVFGSLLVYKDQTLLRSCLCSCSANPYPVVAPLRDTDNGHVTTLTAGYLKLQRLTVKLLSHPTFVH